MFLFLHRLQFVTQNGQSSKRTALWLGESSLATPKKRLRRFFICFLCRCFFKWKLQSGSDETQPLAKLNTTVTNVFVTCPFPTDMTISLESNPTRELALGWKEGFLSLSFLLCFLVLLFLFLILFLCRLLQKCRRCCLQKCRSANGDGK